MSKNPQARRLIKRVGLPIPLPESLRRDPGPWQARPLADQKVLVGAVAGGELMGVVADTLAAAGAEPYLVEPELLPPFEGPGETFGRPARFLDALEDGAKLDALVFDASSLRDPSQLRALYDFFHPVVQRVTRSGRVVVLGRTSADPSPAEAAAQSALDGFTRSIAKELGRGGATANLVWVERGAERRVIAVLRWLLSRRAAFVTAQPIVVTQRARGGDEPAFVRPLEKKTALVTGAARGIGEATARLLAQEGAHVVLLDRPADDQPTSQLAREIGGSVLLLDITADDAPRRIADSMRERGGVDIVVHNAGITRDKTLAKMTPELWDQAIDVNLGAVVRITAELEGGILRDGGRVVCLSSVAGIAGNVGQTNYAASKAGIVGFVRALATRWADRGITANAIAPGFIETRLTIAMPVAVREVARRLSALGQGGLPQDVGQAITFLASPGAQGITGSVLRVCGGALVGA
ncbi:MAG: 3-oxoacyl-ACP reductase [Deltaproteobacteria bacterium]|nr:3-oxoacyl-ACP reductase [Deltaproteobacteria bacterium]